MPRTNSATSSASLETRVIELEGSVTSLRATVRALEARLAQLERAGFELVDEPPSPAAVQGSNTSSSGSSAAFEREAAQASRFAILLGIGVWLSGSLAGKRCGKSGRASLREKSEVYLVVRSAKGVIFDPVRIYQSWNEAERVVKDQGGFKSSLFVGLPTWEDAQVVAEEAGLNPPPKPVDG